MKTYAEKRNFEITSEPKPGQAQSIHDALTFVVQKHAASHLHYDFRLELNGVLVSWAVPKGPSLNPKDKRLAAKVEDHPLDYGGFEGLIPQGQYGGGEVIVWDRGTYETPKAKRDKSDQESEFNLELERGKLEFELHGEKLKGGWVLIHTRDNQWLLMKRKDEFASETDILADDRSVITGHRIGGTLDINHPHNANVRYQPMLLTEIEKPFQSKDWSFELKLDGIRAIAVLENKQVRITSRNDNDITSRFPVIVEQLESLDIEGAVFDGEVVQFDETGHPDFQALVQPFQAGKVTGGIYCIFDLLALKGTDLIRKPLRERRAALEGLELDRPNLRLVDAFPEDGALLFAQARKMGFEGIVGKKLDSAYEMGIRSQNWVKVKGYHSEEFLAVGYTKGDNARAKTFGALLLAQLTPTGLTYCGNVGGGFKDEQLASLAATMNQRKTDKPLLPPVAGMKNVTWIDPPLTVEVRFMNRTKEGRLRFPIFQRLRPDVEINQSPPPEDSGQIAIDQLSDPAEDMHVEIRGQRIHFSHLGKELWPGVTKRDLAKYYATVSEALLTYLKDRPLSFVRCPDGVQGERFFQKHWDKGRPPYVETVSIHSDSNGGPRDFVMCNNLETLLWLAQMGAVELNPWNSRIAPGIDFSSSKEALEESILNRPDYLVLDLDPHFGGKATGWRKPEWDLLLEVAFTLKEILGQIQVQCFPKSSGKSGLHLYVPVSRDYTYDQIRAAATTLGEEAMKLLGKKVTLEWNVKKRPDGVFIDVNQNVRGKTMAAPYSPRAATHPGVSMPLLWDELNRVDPTEFTIQTAPARLAQKGDLWSATLNLNQKLFT